MKRILVIISILILAMGMMACKKAPAVDGAGQTTAGKEASSWKEQYDLGLRLLNEGNYEDAILAFTAVIDIDPRNIDAYIARAEAYVYSGESAENLAQAIADLETVLSIDEKNVEGWLLLADAYIRQGDFSKALEVLKEGSEKTDGAQEIADKIQEIESGDIYDRNGQIRRRSFYDGDGSLIYYHTFTYDRQGREASITSFDGADAQTGHVDLAYAENGDYLVSYSYANKTGAVGRTEWVYDAEGRVLEEHM